MPRQNASASLHSHPSRPPTRPTPTPAEEVSTADLLREARNRGADLLAAGDLEAALTAFQTAVKLAPEEAPCRQKVAEVLQRLGRTHDAVTEYEEAARAWVRLGWASRGVALCKVILQLDPGHARARALMTELRTPLLPPASPPESYPDGVARLLRAHPLFSRMKQPLLQTVRHTFTRCTVSAGEQILTRGQPAQALYLLLSGRCTAFHQHVDGHETRYPDLVEGDVFGEVSLLRSKLVTASVRAVTPCLLLKLERASFEQLVESEPDLRRELQRMGAERLCRTTRLLAGRQPSPERLPWR